MSVENPLKYTNLTYEEQISAIKSKLASNSNLANLRESAEYQTLIEMISAMSDIVNWNLEKRANENFMSIAKLRSSVILLARNLGYDITRAIPAEANIKLRLSGDLTSKNIQIGDVFQIPIYSNFTYNSSNFLLKNTFSYMFTAEDTTNIASLSADFEKIITLDYNDDVIPVVEGEIQYRTIEGSTNNQVGQKFQFYKIEDEKFSNQYGEYDYDIPITTVSVGQDINSAVEYDIDRRSVINVQSLDTFSLGDSKKVCVLRTSNDENIDLIFGDGQYSALGATVSGNGPSTTYDNIYIQYLSTDGSSINQVGVIGDRLTSDVSVTVGGADITSNIEYLFNSNIMGGADIEDIDSIRLNAPNIYYSLDRLVSNRDYKTYLKSLTSPINIKNALSWGEQEEQSDSNDSDPIKKLFNVVMFSCVASLYNLDTTIYSYRDKNNGLDEAVLDVDFDEYSLTNQNYFNVYVKQNVVEQIQTYETSGDTYILYGNEVSIDVDDFLVKYSTANFRFQEEILSTGVTNDRVVEVTFSTITDEDSIALSLQTILQTVSGLDSSGNYYYLFPNISVTWDSVNSRFVLETSITETSFINYIYDGTETTVNIVDSVMLAMGIGKQSSSLIVNDDTNFVMTDKILNVISKLDERSQVNVKNIYISPVIHNMRITGNIYINKLADKEKLFTDINNAIYTWADTQADFRQNIYLSNVIEIIEGFSSVINADIKFEQVDLDDINSEFINDDTLAYITKAIYADEYDTIESLMEKDQYGNQYYGNYKNPYFNMKRFWNTTSNFYYALPASNDYHTPFRDTIDFLNIVSIAYRDNVDIIQKNLLDDSGNISNYSMGNEIVKLNNEFITTYKVS